MITLNYYFEARTNFNEHTAPLGAGHAIYFELLMQVWDMIDRLYVAYNTPKEGF